MIRIEHGRTPRQIHCIPYERLEDQRTSYLAKVVVYIKLLKNQGGRLVFFCAIDKF